MTMRALLPAAVFAALLVASPALAQDPKEEPREEPVPTLTTDDVVPVQVAPPDEGQKAGTPAADEGMTPEERADAEASMKAAAGQGQPEAGAKPDKKVSQEELDWRSDYAAAEEAARAAERRAIETIRDGAPITAFLGDGEEVHMDVRDDAGRSIFGAIRNRVVVA